MQGARLKESCATMCFQTAKNTCCRIAEYLRCKKADLRQSEAGGKQAMRPNLMNWGYDPMKEEEAYIA